MRKSDLDACKATTRNALKGVILALDNAINEGDESSFARLIGVMNDLRQAHEKLQNLKADDE